MVGPEVPCPSGSLETRILVRAMPCEQRGRAVLLGVLVGKVRIILVDSSAPVRW
jgi:hypothetical protein